MDCRICGRQLPIIETAYQDKLMKRSEKLVSLSLWSIWSDTTSLSASLFTFIVTSLLHTGQARVVLSSGCARGLSSTAFFAGLVYFLIVLSSCPTIAFLLLNICFYACILIMHRFSRLLRRDPMGALGYSNKPIGVIKKSSKAADGRPSRMENVVATRNGEVLGRQTVLKSDHCPGCQSMYLPELIEGAPNFREVSPFPVYGVANPTAEGIRAVLQRVAEGNSERPVLWHNMREEPVVYINGKPFVLREVERPYKNMLEYEVSIHLICFFLSVGYLF